MVESVAEVEFILGHSSKTNLRLSSLRFLSYHADGSGCDKRRKSHTDF